MARRRRNLSEKRNEEVKMETINKLLKKQAPRTKGRAGGGAGVGGDETPFDADGNGDGAGAKPRANPAFVRWTSSRAHPGGLVSVPDEILAGPLGAVFGGPREAPTASASAGTGGGTPMKMVEEVA